MSSLLDKPAPSSKTGSAFEKTVPFKSANDVEPQSVTEALFGTLFEEEPVPQTEMPAIASSAEADPATGFVYEPSPEEPIPVTESVFISRQDSDGVTEAFETAFVEPVPATETVWDPSIEEAIAVTSISMKSSSMDRKQGTKILPELATGIPVTELTEETAPEDLSSQTEILFETTSPEPVDEQEEQTELSLRTLTPVTETPFEVSSIEPAPITESLFKSLQKPLPTTESMDELSEDLVLKNIADSIQGHLGTSVAVSKEELSTTPFLETEFSFDSHENIIPRTELPFAGSVESLPKAKVVAEAPLAAQPEEIPQIEVATTLSPLEPIDIDSPRANFTVEAETQFTSANETTEASEVLLNHSQEFAEVKQVLPQHTLDTNIYPENLFKAERQEDAIPQIPASAEEINIALLDIWREALSYTETDTSGAAIGKERFSTLYLIDFPILLTIWNESCNSRFDSSFFSGVPGTILTPDYITMVNLVPQDAPHPLYGDAPETAALRREFLLDYLVLEPLDFQDPRMTQPEGLVVTNLGGKELAFSMDANGLYFA